MLRFLKHIIQLVISPAKGWEDVSHAGVPAASLCREGFYPLLAVAAVSCVFRLFYDHVETSMVTVLQQAIVTFTVYFATLFFAGYVLTANLGRFCDVEPSEQKISTFVIYCLAILVVINILANVIPIELSIVEILPAYVIFVIYKAMRYLDVKESRIGQFMFLAVFTIVVPPFLLSFLFKILMPES